MWPDSFLYCYTSSLQYNSFFPDYSHRWTWVIVCVCLEKVEQCVPLHVFNVDHISWLNIKQLLIVLCESHTAAISRHCSLFKLLVCFGEWVYTFPLYVFCFYLTACSYLKSFHSQFNSWKPFSVLCFVPYPKDLKSQ